MVINYYSVKVCFQKHGNPLQYMIIDYKSETVKYVNYLINYILVIIDYESVKSDSSEKRSIPYV